MGINLASMTPREIDKMYLDLLREQFVLGLELERAIRKATYVYSDNETPQGMVVREVREEAYEETAWGKVRKTNTFFVLASDYEASPYEVSAHGYQRRVSLGSGSLVEVTWAYLSALRLDREQALEKIVADDKTPKGDSVREILGRLEEIKQTLRAIHAEFEARGGWTRFWLVVSSSGHIHSSTACHTCNKGKQATEFALTYHLSGETAERAVEVFGPALCTVCFPDAPVEMTEQARVKQSLARHYFDEGYEGWLKAKEKADARLAKKT